MTDLDGGLAVALADRYDIEREIGQGGMATVYLARDVKLNRRVALKVLRPELAHSLGTERFLQEIAIAAPLVHPNILTIHDSGAMGDHLFYVMPYVEGRTLRQRLDREGQLPIGDTISIVRQVAAALDYAHEHGVVHRDIKPENILLLDGHVLVADFGLAKAITRATNAPLTDHGIIVGTPAYMSPEQAVPDGRIDARSDIYSLACVTFEMIAGIVPFRGANAQAVLVHHVTSDPPALCAERRGCPPHLDAAVRRAMAKLPADRYSSAHEFVHALESAGAPADAPTFGIDTRSDGGRGRRRRWLIGGVGVASLAVLGLLWARSWGPLRATPSLDRSTYVVFPFRHSGIVANPLLTGDACALLLRKAMAQWQDIRMIDGMRVGDLWAKGAPRTVPEAIEAAASLSAGTLAWGTLQTAGDSLEVRGITYDVVQQGTAPREVVVRMGPSTRSLDSGFAVLARSLVSGGTPAPSVAAGHTNNLAALRAFLRGDSALTRFDLRLAEASFRQAIADDDSYADAHLWLARTLSWGEEAPPSAWRANAARAVALAGALPPRDARHAQALLNLAEGKMRQACASYRTLLAADSLDFAAWFGLGECNARDSIVVSDDRSPTGYSFRGSLYTAVLAYQRALELVPSFHGIEQGAVFQRLSRRVLYTEESQPRRGAALPPDTTTFVAFPSFAGDTLAFVPVPYRVTARGLATPPTERAAVQWSVGRYEQIMEDWVKAFPRDGDAQSAFAAALESSSSVTGSPARMGEALGAARRALAGSASDDVRIVRTTAVVRLLLKMDSLAAARALIDSSLRRWAAPDPLQAGYLASLAALTGRARLGAALAVKAAADTSHIPFVTKGGRRAAAYPLPVTATALEVRMYASLGGPSDSLRAAFRRANAQVDAWVLPAERAEARQALFRSALALAYDSSMAAALPGLRAGPDQLLAMREALAAGDTAAVRSTSREFSARAARYLPGSMGTDRLFHHAVILLALGDTSAARTQLDVALAALPRVRSMLTEVPPQAGAVGRAMILRAQLAARAGDRPTAERWARSAQLLWSGADADLRAPLDDLRRTLSSSH